MQYLLIIQCIAETIYRRAWNFFVLQFFQPVSGIMCANNLVKLCVDQVAVFPASRLSIIFGVVEHFELHQLLQVDPEIICDDGNHDIAVSGFVGVIGHMNEMRITDRMRIVAGNKKHGRHIAQHGNLAVEHGNIDMLPLAAAITLQQG